MKNIFFLFLFSILAKAQTKEVAQINNTLNAWHLAAAEARFDDYMNAMTNDAVYIGTDATENWNKKDFMAFGKSYFDKGKAWSFTSLGRNVYIDKSGMFAWFDELLNTQMKICRGSGVMVKQKGVWKIKHYVLSMTIPNDNSNEVIKTKTLIEDKLIDDLKKK
jgi:SnoaL-like domain